MSQSHAAIQSTIRKLGTVHYTPKLGVSVTAFAQGKKGEPTNLIYEGIEYKNAQEWIKKVFQNSGKNLQVVVEKPVEKTVVGTPRPTKYIPPSDKCPFGRFV
jgi:hypothetical protein